MARPDIAEARKLTDGEINDQIDGIRRELFTLRFEHGAHACVGIGKCWIFLKKFTEDAQRGVGVFSQDGGIRVTQTGFLCGRRIDSHHWTVVSAVGGGCSVDCG